MKMEFYKKDTKAPPTCAARSRNATPNSQQVQKRFIGTRRPRSAASTPALTMNWRV